MLSKTKFIIIVIFILAQITNAQTCGFGCLGLSSAFIGYKYQKFDASNLNSFYNNLLNSEQKILDRNIDLSKGAGIKIGGNIFRAKFSTFFITAKGFYQVITQKEKYFYSLENSQTASLAKELKLNLNYWGLGLDFGVRVIKYLDIKIVDASLNLMKIKFYDRDLQNSIIKSETVYKNDNSDIGYYLGSGFIFHIVPNYISVETNIGYEFFKINKLHESDGNNKIEVVNNDLIKNKGVSYSFQLNVGFPL